MGAVKLNLARDPRNLVTSVFLVFPLFLAYQLGVLLVYPMVNGADFLTRILLEDLRLSRTAYLGYVAASAVAFAIAMVLLRRRNRVDLRMFLPMFLESAIYALTMGSLIILVMTKIFRIEPHLASGIASQGLVARMVMSVGAGVWEEAVFRLALLTGLVVFAERVVGMRRIFALLLGLLISAVLFSAVHHIPPHGDPLRLGIFVFRLLAGVFFGVLYWVRGFAVAAYTHALYDIYVLILRP